MMLLSWKLGKRVLSPLLKFALVVSMIFDSEESLFDGVTWIVCVLFSLPRRVAVIWYCHISKYFLNFFWQDGCWQNFRKVIVDGITWKQKSISYLMLLRKRCWLNFLESLENKEHFSCACWFRRDHVKLARVVWPGSNALLHMSWIEC